MRVLVGCEMSGRVRAEFRKRGHEAFSCDIVPSEDDSPFHIQDDVLKHLTDGWDAAFFFAPCTRLCNSGVRWLAERNLWAEMEAAARFFKRCLDAPIPKIACENPIPHKYALEIIGRKYDQIIQPWQFGHGETKATCLWLKNLPPLRPTKMVSGREGRVWKESPGKERSMNRSRTYQGIADAMAEQWGKE